MNLLALLAIISSLGMYAVARYVRRTKTAEARELVTAIGTRAVAYYDASDKDQPAGSKPEAARAMRHFPPPSTASVPADLLEVRGQRYQSVSADWAASPWKELSFSIAQPQYYAYAFAAEGVGANAKAEVTATGDIDADGTAAVYRLRITADDNGSAKLQLPIEENHPEE